ncbi:MAG: DsbA family protein [Alphaproteobacteria bacterium]|nr:DsbA family protein [Alphaproteobacteria bacterium]
MGTVLKAFGLVVLVVMASSGAFAQDARMAERSLGKADAPVKVDEFVSMACSHCAEFYAETLPILEKRYIDTGKVRFVFHDYPLDGPSLKASAIARCMPTDEYVPFVKTLFSTQATWAFSGGDPVDKLVKFAELGGLPEAKARACAKDTKLLDAIIAERTEATNKYKVDATPTFLINDGAETIQGAQSLQTFTDAFDRVLAGKKK